MNLPAIAPRAWINATPARSTAAQSIGINIAASAAFYLAVSDRKQWRAAALAGAFGLLLWRTAASPPTP
ncbi:MAG: hypothetical protein C0434_17685 [Xanthomonadaceae bacterium]|nr:hypothetical protein [Xanthomonadaceae bacterium]